MELARRTAKAASGKLGKCIHDVLQDANMTKGKVRLESMVKHANEAIDQMRLSKTKLESLVTAKDLDEDDMVVATETAFLLLAESKTLHAEFRPHVKQLE